MRRESSQIDLPAVRRIADRLDDVAELIDGAVAEHLAQLAFTGARAGRTHTASGDALRNGLDQLVAELSQWSRASAEIAMALRAGAQRYADAESYAEARIA